MPKRPDLLLEIGTEEIPARFIPRALEDLAAAARASLAAKRLDHRVIRTFGTPRRLTLAVAGIVARQPDLEHPRPHPRAANRLPINATHNRAIAGSIARPHSTCDYVGDSAEHEPGSHFCPPSTVFARRISRSRMAQCLTPMK